MSLHSSQAAHPTFFSELPSYQTACQIIHSWQHFLSRNHIYMLQSIADRTVRFGKKQRFIAKSWFFEGHDPRDRTGYAGCSPVPQMSDKTFYTIVNELKRLGLITVRRMVYRINFDITALELAIDESVQRRVLHENKRGGALSTLGGIMEWATLLTHRLVECSSKAEKKSSDTSITTETTTRKSTEATQAPPTDTVESCSGTPAPDTLHRTKAAYFDPIPQQNKGLPYTFHYKNYGISPSKLGSISALWEITKGYIMGNRTAQDILQASLSAVSAKRQTVRDKAKARGTLADRAKAFERAWETGQRETDKGVPPSRITAKSRRLLKDQLLKRVDPSFDTEAFGHWIGKNWQAIGAQFFAKSKRYPEYPTFNWFIACLETYTTAFEQREYLNAAAIPTRAEIQKRATAAEQLAQGISEAATGVSEEIKALREQLAATKAENRKLRRGSLQSTVKLNKPKYVKPSDHSDGWG